VPLPAGLVTAGVVLIDQIRTIDRSQRMFEIVERVPAKVLAEVRDRVAALLGFNVVVSLADPGAK
jgi:mRNA interferase MazF